MPVFRYHLRSLFASVFVASLFLAYIYNLRLEFQRQDVAVRSIKASNYLTLLRTRPRDSIFDFVVSSSCAYDVENLSVRFLSHAQLPGVQEITHLRKVRRLSVIGREFTDVQLSKILTATPICALKLDETSVRLHDVNLISLRGNRELQITNSDVDDLGMQTIASLTELELLQLRGCPISDKAAKSWLTFKSLKSLDLGETNVSNATCVALAALRTLWSLELDETDVCDVGVVSISTIDSLRHLVLRGCRITDQAMAHLSELGLVSLDLSGTQITDEACAQVSRIGSLRDLYLDNSHITDLGLNALTRLSRLETLSLGGCNISDRAVDDLLEIRNLRWLSLNNTQISNVGYVRLKQAFLSRCVIVIDGTRVAVPSDPFSP